MPSMIFGWPLAGANLSTCTLTNLLTWIQFKRINIYLSIHIPIVSRALDRHFLFKESLRHSWNATKIMHLREVSKNIKNETKNRELGFKSEKNIGGIGLSKIYPTWIWILPKKGKRSLEGRHFNDLLCRLHKKRLITSFLPEEWKNVIRYRGDGGK